MALLQRVAPSRAIGALLLCGCSSVAIAEPVYLSCALTGSKGGIPFEVKLDEQSGQVTHTDADGSAFNAQGFFSVDEVIYKREERIVAGHTRVDTLRQYRINRVDLTVVHDLVATFYNDIENTVKKSPVSVAGKCTIRAPGTRAF